jgi:hypothetical protein
LKGSIVKRLEKHVDKPTTPRKDQNILNDKLSINFLRFSKKDQDLINGNIEKDVELLQKFKLMDYSLLMCVEKVPAGVKAIFPSCKHVMRHVFTSQNIN